MMDTISHIVVWRDLEKYFEVLDNFTKHIAQATRQAFSRTVRPLRGIIPLHRELKRCTVPA